MENIDWEDVGQKTIQNFLHDWVEPEIQRRYNSGELTFPFTLVAAQVLFFPDNRPLQIRLNSEVKAEAKAIYKPGVQKQAGDPIYAHELEGFENLQLIDKDGPDAAHITLIYLTQTWHLYFDFRRNKSLAQKHIETAEDFYRIAEYALEQKLWRPFVDTLFSAAELSAKAILLLTPSPDIMKSKNHGYLRGKYNQYANLGNAEAGQRKAYNRLFDLKPAKYLEVNLATFSETEAQELLTQVGSIIEDAKRQTT